MKNIGPTFGAELIAAGCNDGVSFTVGGTDAQVQISGIAPGDLPAYTVRVQAVIDAHDPTKQIIVIDVNGFTQACKTAAGGIVAANTLAKAYPLFFAAIEQQQWADVQTLIIDAHGDATLNDVDYAAFKAAAVTYNIPITLP